MLFRSITENTCAVIVEPIQGEGGVNCADIQWMCQLVQRARDTGAVVIFDEIQVSTRFDFGVIRTLGPENRECPNGFLLLPKR